MIKKKKLAFINNQCIKKKAQRSESDHKMQIESDALQIDIINLMNANSQSVKNSDFTIDT